MKNPFRRLTPTPTPEPTPAYDPKNPPPSADGWSPSKMRDVVFQTLAVRVGSELAQNMREDFDHHIDEDPINGIEAAWICLTGKLVETIDKFNDALGGRVLPGPGGPVSAGSDTPVSPFTTFRKDG